MKGSPRADGEAQTAAGAAARTAAAARSAPGFKKLECTSAQAAARVADELCTLSKEKRARSEPLVVAFPTGKTPLELYAVLVHRKNAGQLDAGHWIAFNLDEYFGLGPDHPRAFARFMREHLFDALGLDPSRCHIPGGTLDASAVTSHCREYERKILAAGGIDVALLGLGRNGHIAFNEPPARKDSRTRKVGLSSETRQDLASAFGGLEHTPSEAITMGVATILSARRVRVLAFGEAKRAVVRRCVQDAPSAQCPATWLRAHEDCVLFSDT